MPSYPHLGKSATRKDSTFVTTMAYALTTVVNHNVWWPMFWTGSNLSILSSQCQSSKKGEKKGGRGAFAEPCSGERDTLASQQSKLFSSNSSPSFWVILGSSQVLQSTPNQGHASTLGAFRESCRPRRSECDSCISK